MGMGMNITSQGPLLSNASYPNMRQMHPHNLTTTDSFVSMQPQGLIHSQYIPNNPSSNSVSSNNNNSNNTNNNVAPSHPGVPVQQQISHAQIPSAHIPVLQDPLGTRNSQLPGHSLNNQQNNMSAMTENHLMPGTIPNQYNQMHHSQRNILQPQHQMHSMNMNMTNQPNASNSQNSYTTLNGNQGYPNQSMVGNASTPSAGFLGKSTGPKPWHNPEHTQIRDSMIEEIVKLLKSRRPNAAEDWNGKLPHMAKRLEDALYHEASSYEEYSERSTLKQRLQQLALSMGGNKGTTTKPPGQAQPSIQTSINSAQSSNPQLNKYPNTNVSSMPPNNQQLNYSQTMPYVSNSNIPQPINQMPNIQHQHQNITNQMQNNLTNNISNYQTPQFSQNQSSQNQNPQPNSQIGVMRPNQQVNPQYQQLSQNMPNVGGLSGPQTQQNMALPQQMYHAGYDYQQNNQMRPQNIPNQTIMQQSNQYGVPVDLNNNVNEHFMRSYAPPNPSHNIMVNPPPHLHMNQPYDANVNHYPHPQGGINNRVMPNNSINNSNLPQPIPTSIPQSTQLSSNNQNLSQQNADEHRKQVLKQQQQRLLLLRHASKCPHDCNRCPVTPHCWNMKQLWKHIMSCKDQECKMPHCVSSRYVLSHYSKCKEPSCPVCGPVREAIRKNYESSKNVVNQARKQSQSSNPVPENQQVNSSVPPPSIAPVSQAPAKSKAGGPAGSEPPNKKQKRKSSTEEKSLSETPQIQALPNIVLKQPPRKIYPLDPLSSAIYTFTSDQIKKHFETIQEGLRINGPKIKEMCKPIIEELFKFTHAMGVFGTPVDPIGLGLPDYFDIVKSPMDLGTVMKRLDNNSYKDLQSYVSDVHLTFDNAMLYNPKNSDVYLLAKTLKKEFDNRYKTRLNEFEKQLEECRKNKESCLICGENTLKFEPPVYYCNGVCAQRIRRNATYYSNSTNTYFWCGTCYNAIKEGESIRLPDCTVTKAELSNNKKKHTEEFDEPWVECEGGCSRWVHQICSLFNNRRNISDEVSYVCPQCLQEKRKKSSAEEIVEISTKKMKASDLPVTTLSEFLEKRIYKRLEIAYEEFAEKRGISLEEVEKCPPLTLRQVSCLDKLQTVRDGFYNRYKGYPMDFPCRTKCLVLFQTIDGQDVILFGMYVYEYGHKCPQPNQRRVYISYLDSAHYLRPRQYRTTVYHEILISYLDYVKARGFHTAHIWACPPQKGDDYILYVHPSDQKTPKPQILRLWYDEMLKRCVERGIVCEVTDLYTEYLSDPTIEATKLPYFEGDYWVNEAEVIIKNLGDDKNEDDFMADDAAGYKSKRKAKSKRLTKSFINPLNNNKERDPLTAKLANIIEPMKDTFFVARLHPKEYALKFLNEDLSENLVKDEEDKLKNDEELRKEALSGQDVVPELNQQKLEIQDNNVDVTKENNNNDDEEEGQIGNNTDESNENVDDDFSRAAAFISENDIEDQNLNGPIELQDKHQLSAEKPNDELISSENSKKINDIPHPTQSEGENNSDCKISSIESIPEYKDDSGDIQEDKIISIVPELAQPSSFPKRLIMCGEDLPKLTDDTEDVDDIQECEHFDTRQSFLNLCQGNHYQFDQLRRAKHSSMMVLYHLHNPDAPKFIASCAKCGTDILGNNRYHCDKCDNDFCGNCYATYGPSVHNHKLQLANAGNAPTQLTEEQRRERQRSIQLHMQLLLHAANCSKCESKNCAKMKVELLYFCLFRL